MKTKLLMAAMTVGVTLAVAAQARDGLPDAGPRGVTPLTFEQLDANADGAVTPAEMETALQTRATAQFIATDTNGDGALSADELGAQSDARRAERIAKHIEAADANGDGLLQAAELGAHREGGRRAGPARMFERLDANDDGRLSAQEFTRAGARMGERHGRRSN